MLVSHDSQMSAHAATRMAQRGVRKDMLNILLRYGDAYYAGSECFLYQIKQSTLRDLADEGMSEGVLRSVSCLQAVVSASGMVVTCYHASRKRMHQVRRRRQLH